MNIKRFQKNYLSEFENIWLSENIWKSENIWLSKWKIIFELWFSCKIFLEFKSYSYFI